MVAQVFARIPEQGGANRPIAVGVCYVAGSCRHLSLVKSYSTTDKMHKNKGISMYKTKGSGAEAPIHKEPPGAGPYS